MDMQLRLPGGYLSLDRPVVMGILNVTPDSFSDGGRHLALAEALRCAREMFEEGAAIIDVGGESTRPGAEPVPLEAELDRVVPVVERLARELPCVISVDTTKPQVMEAACAAGAALINDVSALQSEGAAEVAARYGAAVCLMHMQGQPRTMQIAPQYTDVVEEVRCYLAQRRDHCIDQGIARDAILLDPGFGFGKDLGHNLTLLAGLGRFTDLECPLLVGLSRKSMFGKIYDAPVERRLAGSIAAAAIAVLHGAAIVRAHDVRDTVEAVKTADAVRRAQTGTA